MDNKKLLLLLIEAKSEEEVYDLIIKHPILSRNENWKPYGNYDGNINTIHNQQKDPVAALAEKPINSIDALLMKECKLRGVDPESAVAPKSMQEAVELFYSIKRGDFSDISEKQRRLIANNIMIITEGSKDQPNITIVDKGEGQHYSNFENTFVSLHRGNKSKILFVQGKYNMGGSGVLRFCGDNHYQLILSKPTKKLLNGKSDCWGFTLVRLHLATTLDSKNSWYEYCVNDKGEIFSFPTEPLSILPKGGLFDYGTYIKLYNYSLPDPSVITLGLWRQLNSCLHIPALPIMLYESRAYKGHSPSKILLGNKMRIMVDNRDSVEEHLTITTLLGKFGKRNVEITVFRPGTSKTEFTTQNDAIFFTINGQTHATEGRSFLKTKCNLYYLADYLLVHIDCSNIPPYIREQVFMASRDRMADSPITKEILETLSEELRKHEGLKYLNQLRKEQQIMKNPKDIKFLEDIVSKLITSNHSLVQYLGIGGGVTDKTEKGKKPIEQFKGKRFPTYLEVKGFKQISGTYRKQIPINSFARLELETDVENNYFDRESENGELIMKPEIMKSFHLYNGIITIKLVPPLNAKVGDVQQIVVELTRPYENSLSVEFDVEYTKPIVIGPSKPLGQTKPPKGKSYSLPEPTLVYKDQKENCRTWQEMDPPWNEVDIVKVVPSGTENGKKLDIFINMDAGAIHSYLRRNQLSEKRQEFVKRCWQTSVYLNSLILYNDLAKNEKNDFYEMIPEIMKSFSKIVLDLMCNTAFLKEIEKEQ